MANCSSCSACSMTTINLHRKVSDLDWDQLNRKIHYAIDNHEALSLEEIKWLISRLEDINSMYDLAIEEQIKGKAGIDLDALFEEYKILKEKEDEASLLRKDEILMIFEKSGVEIVNEGYKSWIVQYDTLQG